MNFPSTGNKHNTLHSTTLYSIVVLSLSTGILHSTLHSITLTYIVEHSLTVAVPRPNCPPHGWIDAFQLRLLERDKAEEWGNMLENLSECNKVRKCLDLS